MHSQNSQAGVDLIHLHFIDAELAKQGEGHLAQGPRGRSGGGGIQTQTPCLTDWSCTPVPPEAFHPMPWQHG